MKIVIIMLAVITLMIIAISKWKVNSFMAILGASFLLAFGVGIPLHRIPVIIEQGFSSIIGSIGLVIIFGALIGTILEQTGAALKLATMTVNTLGKRFPQLSMMLMGWIVSIPVFCDSGFVLLNSIRKALSKRTKVSPVSMAIALSAGLYTSHVLIPPTPGIIASAGIVGLESNLLLVIGAGVFVSVFCLIPALLFSMFWAKHNPYTDNVDEEVSTQKLPSGILSITPILVPIILMALGSMVAATTDANENLQQIFQFVGKPSIALIIGFLSSIPLLVSAGKLSNLADMTRSTFSNVASIIFITAAGSTLGRVIVESGFVEIVKDRFSMGAHLGFLIPFTIAAILKISQGSSTVAMITTASIMGMFTGTDSLMVSLGMGTPIMATLCLASIGSGAMLVSHANDSYFWVVTGFGEIEPQEGYRTQTVMSLLTAMGGLAGVYILYWLCSLIVL